MQTISLSDSLTDSLSQLQEKLEKKEAVNRFQRLSWLCFFSFLLLSFLYTHFSLVRGYPVSENLADLYLAIVTAFMLLQLLLGLYQLVKKRTKLGSISLVISSIYFVVFIYFSYVREKLLIGANAHLYTFIASLGINALMFGSGLVVALLYYRKMGKISFAFPLIYLLLLAAFFVPYHSHVESYRQQLEELHFSSHNFETLPLIKRSNRERYRELTQGMNYVAWTLPPVSYYNLYGHLFFTYNDYNTLFDLWRYLKRLSLARGIWHDALTSPGTKCGGTLVNWDNFNLANPGPDVDRQSLYRQWLSESLFFQRYLVDKFEEREEDFVPMLRERCREQPNCDLELQEIADGYRDLLKREKGILKLLRGFIADKWDIVEPDYSRLEVNDCSYGSKQKYGLRLTGLDCGSTRENLLNVTLAKTNHSPLLTSPDFDIKVYSSLFPQVAAYTPANDLSESHFLQKQSLSQLQSGKEISFTYNTSQFQSTVNYAVVVSSDHQLVDKYTQEGFSFQPGKEYGIEIKLDYGDFSVYAFCEGGNSFYQD